MKGLREKLEKVNYDISKGIYLHESNRSVLGDELEKCEEYEDKIDAVRGSLDERAAALNAMRDPGVGEAVGLPSISGSAFQRIENQLKLPQLPLPEYSHAEGESLDKFIANSETIVDKYTLSSSERFVFLKRQLREEPLLLDNSLQGHHQSYTDAKELLIKAFASPITQKVDVIERLTRLNLPSNGSCYTFVSEMKIIIRTFKSLNVDVETILQYLIWKAMPHALQTTFIGITNNNKPSVGEIEDHIFSAIERYQSLRKKNNDDKYVAGKPNSAVGLAVSVNVVLDAPNYKFKPCVICSTKSDATGHALHKCNKYLTPGAKIEQLKLLGACLKCAHTNHITSKCFFKFRNACYNCSGNHFTFL